MDYNKMTKKELIKYIENLISQRAFTYEDRMKLQIIDKAPFTLWACDKDLKIRLWTCQCENMYGFSKEEALGQVYLQMFVSPDEQMASKKDCFDIIEKGMPFFNCVAQDEGRKGKRNIITNCFRIVDVDTNEYLQAEIGLDISNLDSEKEKYDKVIRESKMISLRKAQLTDSYRNMESHFEDDINEIESHIYDNERKALQFGTSIRQAYRNSIKAMHMKIKEARKWFDCESQKLSELINFVSLTQQCDKIEREIHQVNHKVMLKFQEMLLDSDELFLSLTAREFDISKKSKVKDMKTKKKRFRIALSFPGEYRERIIEKIAFGLAKTFSRDEILYDKFHQAEFARLNLDTYIQNLYHDESELIVVFLCEDYNNKPWCGIEWRAIRELMHDKNESKRIMPIKIGDGKVNGIFNTIDGYITAEANNTDTVIDQVLSRYQLI